MVFSDDSETGLAGPREVLVTWPNTDSLAEFGVGGRAGTCSLLRPDPQARVERSRRRYLHVRSERGGSSVLYPNTWPWRSQAAGLVQFKVVSDSPVRRFVTVVLLKSPSSYQSVL